MGWKRIVVLLAGVPIAFVVGVVVASLFSPHEALVVGPPRGPVWWVLLNKPVFALVAVLTLAGWIGVALAIMRRRQPSGLEG